MTLNLFLSRCEGIIWVLYKMPYTVARIPPSPHRCLQKHLWVAFLRFMSLWSQRIKGRGKKGRKGNVVWTLESTWGSVNWMTKVQRKKRKQNHCRPGHVVNDELLSVGQIVFGFIISTNTFFPKTVIHYILLYLN